jgi:hypothetical protein
MVCFGKRFVQIQRNGLTLNKGPQVELSPSRDPVPNLSELIPRLAPLSCMASMHLFGSVDILYRVRYTSYASLIHVHWFFVRAANSYR